MDDPAKQEALQQLQTRLQEIADHEAESLASRNEWGSINFQKGKALFEETIQLADNLVSLPIELLPTKALQQLKGPTDACAGILNQISEFTIEQDNPAGQRDGLLNTAAKHYETFLTAVIPFVPYLRLQSAEVKDLIAKSQTLMTQTEERASKFMKQMKSRQEEIEATAQAAQAAAAKIGVAQHATKFEERAVEHDKAARGWLTSAAAFLVATAVVALLFLAWLPEVADIAHPKAIQQGVTKLVILSLFYLGVVWSGRNYKAHRHLAVTNRHRQNALSTFETFVRASEDQSIKDAILLEATHCIFAPSLSGYLGGEEETPSNRVMEIVKTATGGNG